MQNMICKKSLEIVFVKHLMACDWGEMFYSNSPVVQARVLMKHATVCPEYCFQGLGSVDGEINFNHHFVRNGNINAVAFYTQISSCEGVSQGVHPARIFDIYQCFFHIFGQPWDFW